MNGAQNAKDASLYSAIWDQLDDYDIYVKAADRGCSMVSLHRAFAVLISALWTLEIVIRDEIYDETIDLSQEGESLDSYHTDTAYWSWCAYSGVEVKVNGEKTCGIDPDKSLAFWSWWLNEAVPTAYLAVDTVA